MATPEKSDKGDGDDPLVCYCMKVRLSTLLALLEAEGAPRELEWLMEATRAGTGCGTCRSDLMGLLISTQRGENA
jgi:NAD(P)H-nitrite reductase large subunit